MFELEPVHKLKFKSNPILRFAIFDNKNFKVYLEGQIFEKKNADNAHSCVSRKLIWNVGTTTQNEYKNYELN